ncbi:hypothetical protein K491DRAFT_41460 [Lophiostoma macrostomum CBS 122681]|uniref:Uncharacterized protein n=1 Tax=Lophiostoma macrostomum CBS 122681 TaxID=1314788 RepID=A0A6A6TLU4_9PLEO|nr:hypothetical protein K491DRAFT_41460 [Lophiostoma macrostomum CBS 122681]
MPSRTSTRPPRRAWALRLSCPSVPHGVLLQCSEYTECDRVVAIRPIEAPPKRTLREHSIDTAGERRHFIVIYKALDSCPVTSSVYRTGFRDQREISPASGQSLLAGSRSHTRRCRSSTAWAKDRWRGISSSS